MTETVEQQTTDEFRSYQPPEWGVDHVKQFLYVEARVANNSGKLNPDNCNAHPGRHQIEDQMAYRRSATKVIGWEPDYSTRVPARVTRSLCHDDWDCMDEFETADLLIHTGPPNFIVRFTPVGLKVAAKLREFYIRRQNNEVKPGWGEWDWIAVIKAAEAEIVVEEGDAP